MRKAGALSPSVNFRTEAAAGVTTFFTMAYIVIVNPAILSTSGTGLPFTGVLTATVLCCFTMTLLMGLYAKLPFAVAPGMGINAFFTYNIILEKAVPWPTALGIVFWAGVLFLLVSVTPLRVALAKAIPHELRCAAAAGIGIFLTFTGLKNAGLVEASPATLVRLGKIGTEELLCLVGIGIIAWQLRRKSPFAFLTGIFVVTLVAWALGRIPTPAQWVTPPDFKSLFFKLDLWGALQLSLLPAILSILFTDLFDSISTFIGVSQATGLMGKDGEMPRMKEGLIVDAYATLTAGLFGTSSGTAYIESAAGIEMGGRTGWTAVFAALCFLPCFFLAPVAGMVPAYATAPVLIVVGAMMFQSVLGLELKQVETSLPAFLTIVLIPLTFSITQGILWGFLAHAALYTLAGRAREVSPMMWVVAGVSVLLLTLENASFG